MLDLGEHGGVRARIDNAVIQERQNLKQVLLNDGKDGCGSAQNKIVPTSRRTGDLPPSSTDREQMLGSLTHLELENDKHRWKVP